MDGFLDVPLRYLSREDSSRILPEMNIVYSLRHFKW
jgi:hypothetical protein